MKGLSVVMNENVNQEIKRYDTDAVKEMLKSYSENLQDIMFMEDELSDLKDRLESVGSPELSDMPKSKSPIVDREASQVAQKVDLENEIAQAKREVEMIRRKIEAVVKQLKKPEQRAVIRSRYLLVHKDFTQQSWEEVSFALFGNKTDYCDKAESYLRRTHKIHNSSLVYIAKNIVSGNC